LRPVSTFACGDKDPTRRIHSRHLTTKASQAARPVASSTSAVTSWLARSAAVCRRVSSLAGALGVGDGDEEGASSASRPPRSAVGTRRGYAHGRAVRYLLTAEEAEEAYSATRMMARPAIRAVARHFPGERARKPQYRPLSGMRFRPQPPAFETIASLRTQLRARQGGALHRVGDRGRFRRQRVGHHAVAIAASGSSC